jgi:hypothetical protein
MVPGYGFLLGPTSWNTGIIGNDIFHGPPCGPSVPNPKLIYMNAVACPWNHPGWRAMAPPVIGHLVLFVVGGCPPPGEVVSICVIVTLG